MAQVQVRLADLVDTVSTELAEAARRAQKRSEKVMQFQECELQMAFSLAGSGSAGIKFWIIELGGKVSKTDSNTISVKFGPIEGKQAGIYMVQARGMSPAKGNSRSRPRGPKG